MLGGRGLVVAAGRTSGRVSLTKCQRRHSYANAQLLVCANNAHQHQYQDFYSGRYPKWLTPKETASLALALGVCTTSAHYTIKEMAKKQKDEDSSSVSKEMQDSTLSHKQESTSTSDTTTMATSSIAAAATFDDGWCEALQEFLSEQTAQFRERLESKESFPESYHTSVGALQGDRPYMEDTFVVGDEGRFVAVFDGHGGSKVSTFLQDRLYGAFSKHLEEEQDGSIFKKEMAPLYQTIRALRTAFQEMEDRVLRIRSMHNEGSTAVAIALHQDDRNCQRTLLSANVGDSRAVLSRDGKAVDLTRDHKATSCHAAEWDDIDGIYRIHGLAIARSIGDRYAKPDVSGQAEIKTHPLNIKDEFVVVASDGLWDVMSSQHVVDYIREKLQEATDMEEMKSLVSDMLAEEAWIRGSTDNICVAIVWL